MSIWTPVPILEYFYLLTKIKNLFNNNIVNISVPPISPSGTHPHLKKHGHKYLIIGVLSVIGIVLILAALSTPEVKKIYQKKPTVEIKTSYNNPFDKNTQYVNPFDKYKNPFVTNR